MAFINDGFRTLIAPVGGDPDLTLWIKEKEVTPPGMDGMPAVDITTMRNIAWRTANPRYLVTLTEFTFLAAYDPIYYQELWAIINVNKLWGIQFPDGSGIRFWGWLQKIIPGVLKEGEQPTAVITMTPSNHDGLGAGQAGAQEVAPVYFAP